MTRETLKISETIAKLTAAGAKNLGVLLAALMKDNIKIKGKTNLNSLIKEGKELKVFGIKEEYLKLFAQEAKKYGILYSVIKDMRNQPPTFDILAKAEDISKINRVFERIDYPIPSGDVKKTEIPPRQENKSSVQDSGLNIKKAVVNMSKAKKITKEISVKER